MAGTDIYSGPGYGHVTPPAPGLARPSAPVLRKLTALARQVPRHLARLRAPHSAYAAHPPIVVNSLPKSGTHLMLQVAQALPGTVHYGSFIAQRPSWAAWHRDPAAIRARLAKIAPAEVLGAHLHHTKATAQGLARLNALHLFIYRDPRAVLVSEVQYLALTARWNALHARFAAAGDFHAQVDLAIDGDGTQALPDVATRYGPYLAWRNQPGVLAIRYEALTNPQTQADVLTAVLQRQADLAGRRPDPALLPRLQAAICPARSHTYTGRDPDRWRRKLTPAQQDRLTAAFAWMG